MVAHASIYLEGMIPARRGKIISLSCLFLSALFYLWLFIKARKIDIICQSFWLLSFSWELLLVCLVVLKYFQRNKANPFVIFKILFIWKIEWQGEREKSSVYWFTTQVFWNEESGPSWSQESRILTRSFSAACVPECTLAGSQIRSKEEMILGSQIEFVSQSAA